MVGAVLSKTPNYGFNKIRFDMPGWHGLEHDNWTLADSLLAAFGAVPSSKGVWLNSTAYTVGDRVADAEEGGLYRCLVSHTSSPTGTFAAARLANPTYWALLTSVPIYVGDWETAVSYSTQDIVSHGNAYYVCVISHISDVFATDKAAGRWQLVFDLNPALDAQAAAEAAQLAAENAQAAAAASATAAQTAETGAETAQASAETAQGFAELAQTGAQAAQAAAEGEASAAAASASAAAGSATAANTSASNAAASAAAAAASYDSFDDRYLGAKASDPTVDNDGNPLLVGALYWNTTSNTLRIYDGANWNASTGGGGMFQGEFGTTGNRDGDIFRVVQQQLDTNTTIAGTHNAHTPGPLTVASGTTLTIASGGNLVIT